MYKLVVSTPKLNSIESTQKPDEPKNYLFGTIKRFSNGSGIVSPIYKCFRFRQVEVPIFWEWYFEAGQHERELRKLVNEGARTGRYNISIDKFLNISVWHPRLEEQLKIADCLRSIDEVFKFQAQKIAALQTHKKGLMQQLFPVVNRGGCELSGNFQSTKGTGREYYSYLRL